ncbi:MAG: molybdopterin-dependent oxidoreductase [Clostridia bacterium]|nr:molybdopterin-dependent oxidoreductase [Clostridia bacterium]
MAYQQDGYTVTRHVCPRNCYDACGMLAYTKNGVLRKVEGDPAHGYTRGKLCAKGYSYVQRVYHPERLKYPLYRSTRGSGSWEQISWEKAMEIIAGKMLELQERYGSLLPVGLNKYSGNFGVLHNAVEGMFNSIGPTTQSIGSPCWSAGLDAQYYDFGAYTTSDPEEMGKAQLVLLWGVNPAWTAIHSMPYVYQAKEQGAKIIVIDPVYTTTAKKADLYLQVNPGSDGALALALAKIILANNQLDREFIEEHTLGWPEFCDYLSSLDLKELISLCGQKTTVVEELAELLGTSKPVWFWLGFGLQRHTYGGQSMRAINALAAMTGNIGLPGAGVQYAHQDTWIYSGSIKNFQSNTGNPVPNRYVNINQFAGELAQVNDPPLIMLWVSCRNLLSQDANQAQLLQLLSNLELIVTVDQFFTPTAEQSDLVLPTTTHFEELDVVSSYWHHWVGLNEQAIKPYYESKSDLEIAQVLAKTLNSLEPGLSAFPCEASAESLLDGEFNQELYNLLGITHWRELEKGPRRANLPKTAWENKVFKTPSGKFEFFSRRALHRGLPAMAELKPGLKPGAKYPYLFLTPHPQHGLNSQFSNLEWALKVNPEPVAYLHPVTAKQKGIKPDSMIRVFNEKGELTVKAVLSIEVPPKVVLCYQGWFPNTDFNVNRLTGTTLTDMGEVATGAKGMAFYDTFVDIAKI